MENKIKNLIMLGNFKQAEKELNNNNINEKILENILLDIAFNEKNICSYTFLCFLLSKVAVNRTSSTKSWGTKI